MTAANESTPLLPQNDTILAAEDEAPISFSFKDFTRYVGPGFMIGVGYLDPGNWATDLAAGSQFGYSLLYIILIATCMAMVLQYLCIKLGVVTGTDLAMACRKHFSPRANMALFVLCELAIIATDLAEVVGTAIALNLLFAIPLPIGVALTSLDVLIILTCWGAKHLKAYEKGVMALVALVAGCFVYLLAIVHPSWPDVARGFLPSTGIFRQEGQLYIAMAIIGATIMPHNLYLHSSIVRYRAQSGDGTVEELPEDVAARTASQPLTRLRGLRACIAYSNLDSVIALASALLINGAILVVAAAAFGGQGGVAEIQDAFILLREQVGAGAAAAFAVALLAAGQSSTITGTLCGQVVTEGFLGKSVQFRPAVQRVLTRLLAIAPAMTAALVGGEGGMGELLVLSQVVLAVQLPFAVWPLVWITSGATEGDAMKVTFKGEAEDGRAADVIVKDFANSSKLKWISVVIAVLITLFNIVLLYKTFF